MNRQSPLRRVDIPQVQYSQDDLKKAFQIVNQLIMNVENPGDVVAASLQFINAAESGYGKPVGYVYVDADGSLKIVRSQDVFAPSFAIRMKLGTITVTT